MLSQPCLCTITFFPENVAINTFSALVYFLPNISKWFGFHKFWLLVYQTNFIPEMRRVSSIRYLGFYWQRKTGKYFMKESQSVSCRFHKTAISDLHQKKKIKKINKKMTIREVSKCKFLGNAMHVNQWLIHHAHYVNFVLFV